MKQRHVGELLALWSLAVLVIIACVYVVKEGKGESASIVIGGLIAALPLLINSIRNIGQAKAMQTMADALGNSAPAATSPTPSPADDALLLDTPVSDPKQI